MGSFRAIGGFSGGGRASVGGGEFCGGRGGTEAGGPGCDGVRVGAGRAGGDDAVGGDVASFEEAGGGLDTADTVTRVPLLPEERPVAGGGAAALVDFAVEVESDRNVFVAGIAGTMREL